MKNKTISVKTSVTKQIVFPKKMVDLVQIKLNQLGINLPEYVRYLILKDTEGLLSTPMLDEETEKAVGRSLEDISAGRYTTLSTDEEIDNYLHTLVENG